MNLVTLDPLQASLEQWNDWRWHMTRQQFCSNPKYLASIGLLSKVQVESPRSIALTPYNIRLLLDLKGHDPEAFRAEMLQTFLPDLPHRKHQWVWARRLDLLPSFPLPHCIKTLFWGKGSETGMSVLEHFYPLTDVLVVAARCPRNCTFCFREVGDQQGEAAAITGGMEKVLVAVQEIVRRKTPHVLVTGGDPCTHSNNQLRAILKPLAEAKAVEGLRIGTRMPVDLPMRFYDTELLDLFREIRNQMRAREAAFRIVTHVNHPCELTQEAIAAIRNIQDCGIEIFSQTVALRGVNDSIETLRELFLRLDRLGARPYKLLHPMPVYGTDHLRISLRKFRQLAAGLYQWLPGTSVPVPTLFTLVGKVPVQPAGRWVIRIPFTHKVLVRSFQGELFLYPDD